MKKEVGFLLDDRVKVDYSKMKIPKPKKTKAQPKKSKKKKS